MGSLASGRACWRSSSSAVAFLWASGAVAQVPGPAPSAQLQAPPAIEPSSPPPPVSSVREPAPAPPLEPAPVVDAPRRPSFLRTEDEARAAEAQRSDRERPYIHRTDDEALRRDERRRATAKLVPPDFVLKSTPWVDFTLTSFWMNERVGNFLNLGAQFGGYFFERLRLSARFVVPLEQVEDDFSPYDSFDPLPSGSGGFSPVGSPNVTVVYSGSVGLILSSTKTFVFAPSVVLQRTDVNDYGTSIALALPFEWTTRRHLRVGFELGLGHAFGGTVHRACYTGNTTSCGQDEIDRPGGTSFLLQYYMGWSLGHL